MAGKISKNQRPTSRGSSEKQIARPASPHVVVFSDNILELVYRAGGPDGEPVGFNVELARDLAAAAPGAPGKVVFKLEDWQAAAARYAGVASKVSLAEHESGSVQAPAAA